MIKFTSTRILPPGKKGVIKPDENGWLSSIEKYNQYNKFYYGEYYLDKEFCVEQTLHYKELGTIYF